MIDALSTDNISTGLKAVQINIQKY